MLAVSSLIGDSLTFDETIHLTSGASYLATGDFRLAPETPPLVQMYAALPLLFLDQQPPGPESPGWARADIWGVGRHWLYELNHGEQLLLAARLMMVVLLLATCFATYLLGRALFGRRAGLAALLLAALSPTYLAHGRLVTTDLPAALISVLALLAFARLMEGFSGRRLLLVCLATAAASLIKFSWPLLLPAYLVMALMAVHRDRSRRHLLLLSVAALLIGVSVWGGIWACFGFRSAPFRGADSDTALMPAMPSSRIPRPASMSEAWETVFTDDQGRPMQGAATGLIRFARELELLPEAYLYGLAYTLRFSKGRPSYLNGQISTEASVAYFPIAFLLKTPLPTLALLLSGLVLLCASRLRQVRRPVLFFGLLAFGLVYGLAALSADYNLGHRHLVPLYPAVFVLAGSCALALPSRPRARLVAPALLLVLLPGLLVHPHYLAFFNLLAGGPSGGHRHLVDSNLDWGQDLKRLAAYAREHGETEIKLAYFGSADPTRYGFACTQLPSFLPFDAPRAELTAGTYVVSATQLMGVYDSSSRRSTWRDQARLRAYQSLFERAESHPEAGVREAAAETLARLQPGRLLAALSLREPDDRIGLSLFVFRLEQDQVRRILAP